MTAVLDRQFAAVERTLMVAAQVLCAVERLPNSRLPRELDCSAADLLRTTVDTVLYGAIRPGIEHEKGS
ncbi:hypothetical protein [Nocardia pseudovaccinii]|uniref:hypothetical protein n=1 Tax=Nocardia pseudovaccinii TaxID=189540 RepID=UPI0007A4202B|nr:hypothetical protein [Nocardia pseudovaccinii]